jgi:hypothetical protein
LKGALRGRNGGSTAADGEHWPIIGVADGVMIDGDRVHVGFREARMRSEHRIGNA